MSTRAPAQVGDRAPAAPRTDAPPRLTGTLATAVAMVLAAFSVQAAFSDHRWMAPVLGLVLLVLLAGALFRGIPGLHRTGLAVVAQTLVGTLGLAALAAPQTMIAVIVPTPATFPGVLAALSNGIDDLYATRPPAESTPGLAAILMALFALIAVLIDGLVSDLRVPKPTGLLLLMVYLIPVILAPAELRWHHFLLIALSYLVLLATPYLGTLPSGLSPAVLTAAASALVLGLLAPLLLPATDVRPSADTGSDDLTVVNPFLDLRDNLDRDEDREVLRYSTTSEQPAPLRLTAVSEFDGENWQPAPFPLDPYAVANDGLPTPPGLASDTPSTEQRLEVDITSLDQEFLPAPYPAVRTEGVSRRWIYDEQTLSIVGNGTLSSDLQYTVDYLEVEPASEQLRTAPAADRAAFADHLALPSSLPQSVGELADDVTAGQTSDYDRAVALQEHFRSGAYEYSLDAPERASSDAIADFLEQRRGFCVQFASAMTVMARHLGIPARIAVGFTPGEQNQDGSRTVTLHNAHAWPELYFEGAGWVRFEPSPADINSAPDWSLPDGQAEDPAPETEPSEEPSEETAAPEEETTEPEAAEAEGGEDGSASSGQAGGPAGQILAAVAIGLAVILVVALPGLLRAQRRRRRLGSDDPRLLWDEVEDLCLDYGRPMAAAETIHTKSGALTARQRERLADAGLIPAEVLARAAERRRYADPTAATSQDSSEREAWAGSLRAVRRLLAAESGPVRRLLAIVAPRSLWRRRR